MIGVVDYDLQTSNSSKLIPPNLEIMKIATYYRLEENTFVRLVPLNDQDLSGYEKIFFFSETSKNPQIPEQFFLSKNVVFGGTTFTNGIYQPFENKIIDFTLPKTSIYKQFLKQKYQDGIKAKIISNLLDDSYYRMYAGDDKLPLPPIKSRKRVYIYDKKFFVGDWQNIIQTICSHKPIVIHCIHPIICNKLNDYFRMRNCSKLSRTDEVILDIPIPLDEIYYMLKKYKKLFLADITGNSQVFLPLGGNFPTKNQYIKDIIYKLNLLYSFWANKIIIKLKYQEPTIGYIDPIPQLNKAVEAWANGEMKYKQTLKQRISHRYSKEMLQILSQQKEMVQIYNNSFKEILKQNYSLLSERGSWRL